MRLSSITFQGHTNGRTITLSGDIYTSDKDTIMFVDTTAGPISLNLPATARINDTYYFLDAFNKWTVNNVTLTSNTYFGLTDTMILDITGGLITAVYRGSAVGWSVGLDQPMVDNTTLNQLLGGSGGSGTSTGISQWPGTIYTDLISNNISLTSVHTDKLIKTDTSAGAFTVVLDTAPNVGDTVGFMDTASSWGTQPLAINPGKYCGISTTTMYLDIKDSTAIFKYVDGVYGWVLMN